MKQAQVITIRPDGSMAGLQRKDGLDMRQFGAASIERATHVMWNETKQKWYIELTAHTTDAIKNHSGYEFPVSCVCVTKALYKLVQGEKSLTPKTLDACFVKDDDLLSFNEYDDAVQAEIHTLDYFRLRGLLI